MMRLPVRIFSDLHLGHKASRIQNIESLRPLFRGAGTVIFNGDTWEELAEPWRDSSATMLVELKAMLDEEGCDAVFLPGNHDPNCDDPNYTALAHGQIVITHGDAVLRDSSPWKREILSNPEIIEEIWKRHPQATKHLETRLEIAREIAIRLPSLQYRNDRSLLARIIDAAFPPKRALAMLSAWRNQGELGARFCETYFPNADFLILGHFHRASIDKIGTKTVINTGSFVVPGRALWVSWDGETLATGRIAEHSRTFSMAPKSDSWNFFRKIDT